MQTVLVVGASLGGLRAAEQLRAHGYAGRLVVLGEERWMPYNRPPLSKEALQSATATAEADELASRLAFRPRAGAADVEWRLGVRAESADLDARTVTTSDGETLRYAHAPFAVYGPRGGAGTRRIERRAGPWSRRSDGVSMAGGARAPAAAGPARFAAS